MSDESKPRTIVVRTTTEELPTRVVRVTTEEASERPFPRYNPRPLPPDEFQNLMIRWPKAELAALKTWVERQPGDPMSYSDAVVCLARDALSWGAKPRP